VLAHYLLLVAVVFGVNLLPAFGPPTWAVLVFFRLEFDLRAVPMIAVGALSAAAGRFVLAHAARLFRSRLSPRRVRSLAAAQRALLRGRARSVVGLALFALSPVPSAQLFVGAGLMSLSLLPLTAAFFGGRLVSYSIFVGAATGARHDFGAVLLHKLTSPLGIALEVLMLAGLALLMRVDWARVIARARARRARRRRLTRQGRSGA
jgi:membrane protein YqaA with SNARE-associated domain